MTSSLHFTTWRPSLPLSQLEKSASGHAIVQTHPLQLRSLRPTCVLVVVSGPMEHWHTLHLSLCTPGLAAGHPGGWPVPRRRLTVTVLLVMASSWLQLPCPRPTFEGNEHTVPVMGSLPV